MKVIIVEDEYFTAKRLESLLKEGDREVEVLAILQSVEECEEWWKSNDEPDLAFIGCSLSSFYCLPPFG